MLSRNPRRDSWRLTPQAILDRDEQRIAYSVERERVAASERVLARRALRLALRSPGPRSRPSAIADGLMLLRQRGR